MPLIDTGKTELGWMERSVWQRLYAIVLEGGLISAPIEANRAYTMRFLNEICGGEE